MIQKHNSRTCSPRRKKYYIGKNNQPQLFIPLGKSIISTNCHRGKKKQKNNRISHYVNVADYAVFHSPAINPNRPTHHWPTPPGRSKRVCCFKSGMIPPHLLLSIDKHIKRNHTGFFIYVTLISCIFHVLSLDFRAQK